MTEKRSVNVHLPTELHNRCLEKLVVIRKQTGKFLSFSGFVERLIKKELEER